MKLTLNSLVALAALAVVGCVATSLAEEANSAYPLTTCVVSGEKLGEMGPPVVINHQGTEVRFCCNGCVKKFNADPAKYLAKLGKKETSQ
jgi:YHS domain-containing protein